MREHAVVPAEANGGAMCATSCLSRVHPVRPVSTAVPDAPRPIALHPAIRWRSSSGGRQTLRPVQVRPME